MTAVVRAAFLTISMRWFDRAVGIVSTLVLARLLVPDDFGIVAMASLVIALADVLLNLGVHVALIQNQNPSQAHYDTAWTLRLIQTFISALLVFLAAPLAATYFKEPRVVDVMRVLSVCFLMGALENIGVVTFQKEMRFGQDFLFLFFKRVAGFAATMLAAWVLRSYWALVVGTFSASVVGVINSYRMHRMRPHLGLKKFRDVFGVSQWMLMRSMGLYLESRLHQFVVGGRESTTTMGAYSLADEISAMPTSELLAPLNRVLFPAFVRVKHDLDELKRIFLLAQGVQVLVALPAGVGLSLVAHEAVVLLLGTKWLMAVPFVQIISLVGLAGALMSSASYVLVTIGKVKLVAIYSWLQVGLFAGLAYLAYPHAGALQIAEIRLGVASFAIFSFFWLLLRVFPSLRLTDLVRQVYRPILATALMAWCIQFSVVYWSQPSMLELLILKVSTGAAVYTLAILALWLATGKPQGAEHFLLDKVRILRGGK